MSLQQGRPSVADDTPLRRRPQPRLPDATRVRPVAATAQNRSVGGEVVNDLRCAVRQTNNPACGMRMSALLSADRQQQQPSSPQSPTSSSVTYGKRATAARLSCETASGVQPCRTAKPHVAASSRYSNTSSVDSTYSEHRATVAARRLVRTSEAADNHGNVTDKQHSRGGRNSSASYLRRRSAVSRGVVSSETDDISSSRSDCSGPPARPRSRRHEAAAAIHIAPTRCLTPASQHLQPAAAIAEPRRRCYNLRTQLSESDVDDLSTADSTSTIMSVDSSSSLSSGTLTADADESTEESKTTADRERPRRDVGHFDTSSHAPSPLHRKSITVGHKTRTKPPNRHAICASCEVQSPSSTTSTEDSLRPAEKYSNGVQRIVNYGLTAHAPATVSKHIVSPPTQPQNSASPRRAANRPRSRQSPASASSTSNTPSSPQWLPSESTTTAAKNTAKYVVHSSPVVQAVGRGKQAVFANGSSWPVNISSEQNKMTVKPPSLPPQTRLQTAAVKKVASAAGGVSNPKSPVSHLPVSSSSKVVEEKLVTFQSSLQRASGTANKSAAPKISSASHDYTRRTGSGAHFHKNIADKDNTKVTNDRKVVEKSIGSPTTGVVASQATAKPIISAVRQVKSSQNETVRGTDISHSAKTFRDIPTPSTRSTRTQTPVSVVTRSADSSRGNESTAVTKRPPPPPSKLRRPGSISGTTAAADRGRASATEQKKRPASTDCSAVSSVCRQPVDVCRKKSDSCTDVANRSASIEQAITTRKPAEGFLNKNDHLTKSHDCITTRSNNSENENSDVVCSQMHGSSTSLADMPPRRLVKPYSVINRCSNFVRRVTALRDYRSSSTDGKAELESEHVSVGSRSSLASLSQTRASELFDLPEVDEFECDRPLTTDRMSSDERNRGSDDGQQQTTVHRTEISPLMCPSIPQRPARRYKTEYLTFLSGEPPRNDESASNNSSPHRDCVYTAIKRDKNDMENICSFKTQYSTQKTEDFRLVVLVEPANAERPATLSAEMPITENATAATAEVADKPSSADNYIVTYESDNIVVLDREPVVDCLTPDGDVVSTEVCQLLTVPTNSVGTASGEGGLSRSLPLSESGYDTWKSSQGSVAVAATGTGSICIVAPDHGAQQQQQQQQRREEDGTLRDRGFLKTFDSQNVPPSSEKNLYTEGYETCPAGDNNSSALLENGHNLFSESTNTESGAAAAGEFKDDDNKCGESPSRVDDNGRVADGSVEDSARRDAQMFVSICSDAVDQVAGGASSSGKLCASNSAISPASWPSLSPPDNAASVLADRSDICFSSQTIPSSDSDVLPTFRVSSHNAAHLERFDDEVHNVSSLLPGMDHSRCNHVAVEISESSNSLAEVVQDETCRCSAVISTSSNDFDAGEDCYVDVQQLDQHRGVFDEVCLQLKSPWENTNSVKPSSSTARTAEVSISTSPDPYETICDDLLESTEANTSDEETSHPSFSASPAAASCSTDVMTSERSEELTPTNDYDTTLTKTVAVDNRNVEWQTTHGRISTLNRSGPPLSTTVTGCFPVTTLRRVRTNFSVVYRQTATQSTASQSSAHGGHVKTKARTHETPTHRADHEPGTQLGCRRALAVLASRLDDNRRRHLAETNVDERAVSSSQSVAVDHDPDIAVAALSPAVSLSSDVRMIDSSSTVTGDLDVTVARNDVAHKSDLHNTLQSPLNVQEVKSVSAESKLPISTRASSTPSSTSKKPSTFRKFLSSKLTSAVRRTRAKSD